MNIKVEFSIRLQECIEEKWPELKQKQVAKLLGVSQATLSEWLAAKKMPGLEKFIEICLILNVAVDWLATGRGSKHPQLHKSKILNNLSQSQINDLKILFDAFCKEEL